MSLPPLSLWLERLVAVIWYLHVIILFGHFLYKMMYDFLDVSSLSILKKNIISFVDWVHVRSCIKQVTFLSQARGRNLSKIQVIYEVWAAP
jgi:hypothetical protein